MSDPLEIAKHTHDVAAAVATARPLLETVSGDAFALARQVERNSDDIGMLRQQAERVRTFDDLGTELKSVTQKLDGAAPQLQTATTESQALAKAAQAALNPTPKSQQVAPGSASHSHAQSPRQEAPTQQRDR